MTQPSLPFFDEATANVTASANFLRQHWREIRAEAVALDEKLLTAEAAGLTEQGDWNRLLLWQHGEFKDECKFAPRTCELVKQIPVRIAGLW